MRLTTINDGRYVGLVQVDEAIERYVRYPSLGSYVNVTDSACRADVALQDCTTDSLKPDALTTNALGTDWLWAGDTVLGPAAQNQIGSLVLSRARNNQF
jgi:hypothetical protein